MYYLIYKITNIVNHRFYIGAHKTNNIDDDYMGSGKVIKRAIKKYGIEHFTKEILYIFDNQIDMFLKEVEIVNKEFVDNPLTYNLREGGKGGYTGLYHLPEYRESQSIKKKQFLEQNPDKLLKQIQNLIKGKEKNKQERQHRWNNDPEFKEKILLNAEKARKLTLTDDSKQKRKETYKLIGHQQGEKNSQFGKMWIYSIETLKSKMILKTDSIPEGWIKGRKI